MAIGTMNETGSFTRQVQEARQKNVDPNRVKPPTPFREKTYQSTATKAPGYNQGGTVAQPLPVGQAPGPSGTNPLAPPGAQSFASAPRAQQFGPSSMEQWPSAPVFQTQPVAQAPMPPWNPNLNPNTVITEPYSGNPNQPWGSGLPSPALPQGQNPYQPLISEYVNMLGGQSQPVSGGQLFSMPQTPQVTPVPTNNTVDWNRYFADPTYAMTVDAWRRQQMSLGPSLNMAV